MCNVCNTGYNVARSSCRSSGCSGCGLFSSLFNADNANVSNTDSGEVAGCYNSCGSYQTVCRDCQGCLRIQNHNCCHHCHCGCGNNANNGTDSNANGSGNGNWACLTYCGYVGNGVANTAIPTNTGCGCTRRSSCSYARNRGCGCNGYNV